MAKQNEKKAKGAGGKLARSEIIQARLSPKIRFAGDILARLERRTLSSQIETIIENTAKDTTIELKTSGSKGKNSVNLMAFVDNIWHFDEATRFVVFALSLPNLLTEEEAIIFRKILDSPHFWIHTKALTVDADMNVLKEEIVPMHTVYGLLRRNLSYFWEKLKIKGLAELSEGERDLLRQPGEIHNNKHFIFENAMPGYQFNFQDQRLEKSQQKTILNNMSTKINSLISLLERQDKIDEHDMARVAITEGEMQEFIRNFIKER